MDERARQSPGRRLIALSAMAIVLLVLSACGTGGDDENPTEPAETVEAPTEEAVTDLTGQTAEAASSPTEEETAAETPEPGGASPTPAVVVSAPPIVVATAAPTGAGTAQPPGSATPEVVADAPTPTVAAGGDAGRAIGDGTGGAQAGPSQSETPPAAGTPASGDDASAVVTNCDVSTYPPYSGDAPTQITTSEVNFRAGPGVDCDAINGPLSGGVAAQLLSDPVTREGDDQYQWVLVSIDGTEGWLTTEFLEPAPE